MAGPAAASSGLPTGQIRFTDHYQPGLADGTYEVTATLEVSASGASVPPAVRRLVVRGPRFALDPGDIHAQYPPAAATGTFAHVLPHVVFTKRLLPWERQLPTSDPALVTPWLALLAFSPEELQVSGKTGAAAAATAGYAETMTVPDLLAARSATVRVPQGIEPAPGEEAMSCQVISIASSTFASIVPTSRELPFLAHGRDVGMAGKALPGLPRQGQFSVVVANRFPAPGTATAGAPCIMHLVSLEGFGDLLTGTAPVTPPEATVKLVSLYSWTFGCLTDAPDPPDNARTAQNQAQTFAGLVRNLGFDGTAPRLPETLLLTLPFTPSGATEQGTAAVETRLRDGYLALGYHTRTGDNGFAWYRGPVAPALTQGGFTPGRFATADAAMIFDPGTGVFDLSLAAAWQCGRSLALADQGYAAALMRLRRQARSHLHQLTAGNADLPGGVGPAHPALAALVRAGALQQIGAAASGAAGALAPPAPSPATPSPVPVQRLKALLGSTQTQAELTGALTGSPDAQAVATWLGRLLLLEGIPFDHLVPDARMLPPGSIRFGYLDQRWMSALIDGALAIGTGVSHESSIQDVLSGELTAMAARCALTARAGALRVPHPAAPAAPGTPAAPGMPAAQSAVVLIRSALVTGWPGVTIRGTLRDAGVPLLRLDTVRPDVLVAIFAGVPDAVTLEEPYEGLAFGVTAQGDIATRTTPSGAAPRNGTGIPVENGAQIPVYDPRAPAAGGVSMRPGGERVLNVNSDRAYPGTDPPQRPVDLLGLIAHGLDCGTGAITPARFALQMIQGPEQLTFALAPSQARPMT